MAIQLITLSELKAYLEKTDVVHDSLLTTIIQHESSRIQSFINRNLKKTEYTEYFNGGRKMYYVSAYPIDTDESITVTVDGSTGYEKDSEFYVWDNEGILEFSSIITSSIPRAIKVIYTGGYPYIYTLSYTSPSSSFVVDEVIKKGTTTIGTVLSDDTTNNILSILQTTAPTAGTITGQDSGCTATISSTTSRTVITYAPDDLKKACILQSAYNFRRRKDIGLSSISMPDGSIGILNPTELLPEVKSILKYYRRRPSDR